MVQETDWAVNFGGEYDAGMDAADFRRLALGLEGVSTSAY